MTLHLKPLAALALAAPALATVVAGLPLEELVRRAPVVVRARTGQSMAAWDEGHRKIWTWTELEVLESFKGRQEGFIIVKQPGGLVEKLGQSAAGAARFQAGQESVLFLEPATDENGAFVVLGLAFGKVDLEQRLGTKLAVRHLEGLALAQPGSREIRPAKDVEIIGTAQEFVQRVRQLAREGNR